MRYLPHKDLGFTLHLVFEVLACCGGTWGLIHSSKAKDNRQTGRHEEATAVCLLRPQTQDDFVFPQKINSSWTRWEITAHSVDFFFFFPFNALSTRLFPDNVGQPRPWSLARLRKRSCITSMNQFAQMVLGGAALHANTTSQANEHGGREPCSPSSPRTNRQQRLGLRGRRCVRAVHG